MAFDPRWGMLYIDNGLNQTVMKEIYINDISVYYKYLWQNNTSIKRDIGISTNIISFILHEAKTVASHVMKMYALFYSVMFTPGF